jgi:hypothetical protein
MMRSGARSARTGTKNPQAELDAIPKHAIARTLARKKAL